MCQITTHVPQLSGCTCCREQWRCCKLTNTTSSTGVKIPSGVTGGRANSKPKHVSEKVLFTCHCPSADPILEGGASTFSLSPFSRLAEFFLCISYSQNEALYNIFSSFLRTLKDRDMLFISYVTYSFKSSLFRYELFKGEDLLYLVTCGFDYNRHFLVLGSVIIDI